MPGGVEDRVPSGANDGGPRVRVEGEPALAGERREQRQDPLVDPLLLHEGECTPSGAKVGSTSAAGLSKKTRREPVRRVDLVELPVVDAARPVGDDDPPGRARHRHPPVAPVARRQRRDGAVERDPHELHRLVVARLLDPDGDELVRRSPGQRAAQARVGGQLPPRLRPGSARRPRRGRPGSTRSRERPRRASWRRRRRSRRRRCPAGLVAMRRAALSPTKAIGRPSGDQAGAPRWW